MLLFAYHYKEAIAPRDLAKDLVTEKVEDRHECISVNKLGSTPCTTNHVDSKGDFVVKERLLTFDS